MLRADWRTALSVNQSMISKVAVAVRIFNGRDWTAKHQIKDTAPIAARNGRYSKAR